ncbi:hypothetical protein VOLCADRAFT_96259 [Volvox carteri f. nagariensis]|uniref:Uncharacterized protein n=1 Tax=Volvox carteri f. nagariensis TaxID=3068 RepID=D8U9M7_VOLCA|nr:uncharacterized protein VOLCADRAFT_96259 [Volvox carteri f. nagariensis]EFJ43610.1 hypothetical protein VOLCADRAFT_96259 [Volvox carteri f. nagariensis]|eukprot:XP_002955310.1 hypothetical protein VOLCADRAFT_96259 [Volvox carteri f. nagariensis]
MIEVPRHLAVGCSGTGFMRTNSHLRIAQHTAGPTPHTAPEGTEPGGITQDVSQRRSAAAAAAAAAAVAATATSQARTHTSLFQALLLHSSAGHVAAAVGARRNSAQLPALAGPPDGPDAVVLDSCRRCAAFSASDFLADAPDLELAGEDPYWRDWLTAPPGDLSSSGGGGGGGGGGGSRAMKHAAVTGGPGDVRRQQCRRVGSFLGAVRNNEELEAYRQRIVRYVRSPQYRARAASIARPSSSPPTSPPTSVSRGILISAGGARYTANLIVTLHVVRHHWGCKLPVEVAWQGPEEMDNVTWASLERHFAPIWGFDVRAAPHPVPELHSASFQPTSYSGKVYALALCSFREQVLMLDADSLPLKNPETLFEDPRFVKHGSLFWPDAWTAQAHSSVYGLYGIDYGKAQRVLSQGLGFGRRDAESGQLLFDRARHLDVLEALLMINRHPTANRFLLWGDKDSFSLAFAAVGKAHCYNQVSAPPSAYLLWSPDKLLTKATSQRGPGWLLGGFVQHLEDVPYVYGMDDTDNRRQAQLQGEGPAAQAHPRSRGDLRGMSSPSGEMHGANASRTSSASAAEPEKPATALPLPLPPLLSSDVPRAKSPAVAMNSSQSIPPTPVTAAAVRLAATPSQPEEPMAGASSALTSSSSPSSSSSSCASSPSPLTGLVSAAFLHRTMAKLRADAEPALLQLITAPMTQRWASYFLAHDNLGPTRGVPWDYCVPESAVEIVKASGSAGLDWAGGGGGGGFGGRGGPPAAAALPSDGITPEASSKAPGQAQGLWTWLRQRNWSGGGGGGGGDEHEPGGGGVGCDGRGNGTCRVRRWRRPPRPREEPLPPPQLLGGDGSEQERGDGACPLDELYDYLKAVDSGLPLDRHPPLEALCANEVHDYVATANAALDRAAAAALAAAAAAATIGGRRPVEDPSFLAAFRDTQAAGQLNRVPLPRSPAADFYPYIEAKVIRVASPPRPLPAVQYDWQDPWPCETAPFVSAIRASYMAYVWLHEHQREFPIVMQGAPGGKRG